MTTESDRNHHRPRPDAPFLACLVALAAGYLALIVALIVADISFTTPADLLEAFGDRHIRFATALSLTTCTLSALLSMLVAVPTGYLLARHDFPGKRIVETLLDVPIVLPPLVVGISLLILLRTTPGQWAESAFVATLDWTGMNTLLESLGWRRIRGITYEVPAIVLAQFAVAAAFAVSTMRVTFERIDPRCERVALTLGASRGQAFRRVVLPEARHGLVTAAALAWARAMGEFGPILVFAGTTRMKTEVLPTTIYLELAIGNLSSAVAVSLLLVSVAVVVLVLARVYGLAPTAPGARST